MLKQKDAAAGKKFDEAAKLRKATEEAIAAFERDPVEALNKMGKDGRAIIQRYLKAQDEYAKLTPEQQEMDRLKRELADRDTKLQATEAEKKAAKDAELVKQTEGWLEQNLLEAAKRHAIDGTPDVLEMMANVGLELGEQGVGPSAPGWADYVAKEAQRRVDDNRRTFARKDIGAAVKAGDMKALKQLLGDEAIALILKDSVTQMPGTGQPRVNKLDAPVERQGRGHVSPADFDRQFGFAAKRKP
jgi:hypothetical protein